MISDNGFSKRCPVCSSRDVSEFFSIEQVPANVCIQWTNKDEALRCPKGDIKLIFCYSCGFVWNELFDHKQVSYNKSYENPLCCSPMYKAHMNKQIDKLIRKYDLHDKDIIEIGCGKGDFLHAICKKDNRGIGFDTSYDDVDGQGKASNVKVIRDMYSEKYADFPADMICCRFVFEHIEEPKNFLRMIRDGLDPGRDTILFFEVPNVSHILNDMAIWDIIFEHCNHFGLSSLRRIFSLCGFEVIEIGETFGGQSIIIEARACKVKSDRNSRYKEDLKQITKQVSEFAENSRRQIDGWRQQVEELKKSRSRTVVWGAGARGVSFFNILNVRDSIEYIVDINPNKHGKFVPGTGQRIVPPDFLSVYQPENIILANPIYKKEIEKTVAEMGLFPQYV